MFVKLAVVVCFVGVALAWDRGYNGYESALDRGEYTGDGDYRGEGLAESGAYGGDTGAYHGGWNGAPTWNAAPAWNAAPSWNGGETGEYTGDGDYHGEGLAESGAYGDSGHYY